MAGKVIRKKRKLKGETERKNRNDSRITKKNLTILVHNTRGLLSNDSKFKLQEEIKYFNSPDIVLTTETFLPSNEVTNGKNPQYKDYYVAGISSRVTSREANRGGGSIILVKNGLLTEDLTHTVDCINEKIQITKVKLTGTGKCISCIYRAPQCRMEDEEKLYEYLRGISRNEIIVGDLNLPHVNWESLTAPKNNSEFLSSYMVSGMTQIIKEPTRGNPDNVLDIIMTHEPEKITEVTVHKDNTFDSDHYPITAKIEIKQVAENKREKFEVDDYAKADFTLYHQLVEDKNDYLMQFHGTIEEANRAQNEVMKEAWKIAVPKKIVDPNKKFTSESEIVKELRRQIRNKRTYMKRSKNARNLSMEVKDYLEESLRQEIKTLTKDLKKQLIKERIEDENRVFEKCGDAKGMKLHMEKFNKQPRVIPTKIKVDGNEYAEQKEVAEQLALAYMKQHTEENAPDPSRKHKCKVERMPECKFRLQWIKNEIDKLKVRTATGPDGVSAAMIKYAKNAIAPHLTNLFRTCYDRGEIPEEWRLSTVSPIHKGGDKTDTGQWRPIAVGSQKLKLNEKVITTGMMKYMERKKIWAKTQFAFRKGSSVVSNLVTHDLNIRRILRKRGQATIILCDAKKAYDKIDFQTLYNGMMDCGMPEKTITLIMNILTRRYFQVKVGDQLSEKHRPTSGCVQGSAASPIIFNMACNTACYAVAKEDRRYVQLSQFADDIKITAETHTVRGCEALKRTLANLEKWAKEHGIYFHGGKTKQLRIGKLGPRVDYFLDGVKIQINDEARDLGVHYNSNFNNHTHFGKIVGKINSWVYKFKQTVMSRDIKTMTIAWNALMASRIIFGIQIWGRVSRTQFQTLVRIQRRFLRGAKECENCPEILKKRQKDPKARCSKHVGPDPIDKLILKSEVKLFHDIQTGKNRVEGKLYEEEQHARDTRRRRQGMLRKIDQKVTGQEFAFANRVVDLWNAVNEAKNKTKYKNLELKKATKGIFKQILNKDPWMKRPDRYDYNEYKLSSGKRRAEEGTKRGIIFFRPPNK